MNVCVKLASEEIGRMVVEKKMELLHLSKTKMKGSVILTLQTWSYEGLELWEEEREKERSYWLAERLIRILE